MMRGRHRSAPQSQASEPERDTVASARPSEADAALTWQQPAPEDAPGVSQLEAPHPAAAPLDSPVQETPAKVSALDVPPPAALQVGTSSGDSLAEGRSDSDDDDDDDDSSRRHAGSDRIIARLAAVQQRLRAMKARHK